VTNSAWQERMAGNPYMAKRGRRKLDGAKATHAQWQVLDLTQEQVYKTHDARYDPTVKHYIISQLGLNYFIISQLYTQWIRILDRIMVSKFNNHLSPSRKLDVFFQNCD